MTGFERRIILVERNLAFKIMSNADENNVCANCGVAEVDDIQLEECDGCDLVRYCSDKCMEGHREEHEEDCKKRQTELSDKKLFTQPDGINQRECPLCCLPLPLDPRKCSLYSCCSKLICEGCCYIHKTSSGGDNCPFCRKPWADDEERHERMMKRVKANDPAALTQMGTILYHKGNFDKAFRYCTMAAELGNVIAHSQLGYMYGKGEGVAKDEEKGVYHYEKAAIGGHHIARYNLGCVEEENGNADRAVKHFIIAANIGDEKSMKELWKHYSGGNITKEDLEATLRTHKAAVDATKSPEREAAEAWRERQRGA